MATPPIVTCGTQTGASSEVSTHLNYITQLTSQTVEAAIAAAETVANYDANPIQVNISIDDVSGPTSTPPPDAPKLTKIALSQGLSNILDYNPGDLPLPIDISGEPIFYGTIPDPTTVPDPVFTTVTIAPAPTVVFDDIAPEYDPLETPQLGEMLGITIPAMPPDLEILFEGIAPTGALPSAPSHNFSFYEDEYSSDLLDATRAKIMEIYNGGNGLPAAVAQVLRDREYSAVDANAEQALQAVDEEWTSRGFNLPQGQHLAARRKIRTTTLAERNKASANIYIKEVDTQIDMLKVAMSNGIALEDILIRMHMAVQQRRLDAARALVESSIAIFNAQIARENLELATWQAHLAVYEGRLRGEQLKLDRVKTFIEAQGLINQINQQTVQIYAERFKALQINADVYRSEVEGYKAQIDAKRAIFEGYKAYVDGQRAVIESNMAHAQVFAEKVRAQGLYQEAWKTRVEVFSTQVQAWSTGVQTDVERYKAELEAMRIEADVFRAQLQRTETLLDVERTRIAALTGENQQALTVYGIAAQSATASNEAKVRRYLAQLSEVEAEARIGLENGRINSENANSANSLSLRAKETTAQIYSNMAASFAAAINVNASISDTYSTQAGCSTSINYSSTFE